jgi:hypothetical protein
MDHNVCTIASSQLALIPRAALLALPGLREAGEFEQSYLHKQRT